MYTCNGTGRLAVYLVSVRSGESTKVYGWCESCSRWMATKMSSDACGVWFTLSEH